MIKCFLYFLSTCTSIFFFCYQLPQYLHINFLFLLPTSSVLAHQFSFSVTNGVVLPHLHISFMFLYMKANGAEFYLSKGNMNLGIGVTMLFMCTLCNCNRFLFGRSFDIPLYPLPYRLAN
ncbi:hypothetical protein HAX54_049847 [Datura stramonium]|uniref:Uncharacterized protein n=1 Tax=Datura stramonium TaxID=4076 RepID=A0ABS8WNL5_DATST|nr:hypothetical protein [Datura stramonium]